MLKPSWVEASPGCRIALLPVESLSFEMSWDTGRYLPMAQIGQQINHYCVEAMGLPVAGRGGVDRVGKSCRPSLDPFSLPPTPYLLSPLPASFPN